MNANLHRALHWMHDETATVGHWCSLHILHDYHFWLYLMIAVLTLAFIALLVGVNGSGVTGSNFPYYYYPYGTF